MFIEQRDLNDSVFSRDKLLFHLPTFLAVAQLKKNNQNLLKSGYLRQIPHYF